jgi:hypothetical protein
LGGIMAQKCFEIRNLYCSDMFLTVTGQKSSMDIIRHLHDYTTRCFYSAKIRDHTFSFNITHKKQTLLVSFSWSESILRQLNK